MNDVERFIEEQRASAIGQRLELLKKPLLSERKLLETLASMLGTFEGLIMEYEIVSIGGARNYIDIYYYPLRIAFEVLGFFYHGENLSRDKFDQEQARIRSLTSLGHIYFPISRDELDKRPDMCKRDIYQLLGRLSASGGSAYEELSVYEREVIRYGLRLNRFLKVEDVQYCLQMGYTSSRTILNGMLKKELLLAVNKDAQRVHYYQLSEKAIRYMM
ncbi:hypothetical protein ACFO9Q_08500 [Paenibacillus sp. GCM10023252]|uniref:hypothetical protein n=1 Tax=Paenibacillus sp. GCM10023252 TaxID=3252649 RepID=UPI00361CA6F4